MCRESRVWRLRGLWGALLTLAVSVGAAEAQTGTVTGRVVDDRLAPLASAQVYIAELGTGVLTRADGNFVLVNVPAGTHTVGVRRIGFREATQQVTVAAGQSANVTFQMEQDALALDWPELLDRHVFSDNARGLGRAAYELGNAYLHAGSLRPNASVLFWILIKPERVFSPPGVTQASLGRTLELLERAGEALACAQLLERATEMMLAHLVLGLSYRANGRRTEAAHHFTSVDTLEAAGVAEWARQMARTLSGTGEELQAG